MKDVTVLPSWGYQSITSTQIPRAQSSLSGYASKHWARQVKLNCRKRSDQSPSTIFSHLLLVRPRNKGSLWEFQLSLAWDNSTFSCHPHWPYVVEFPQSILYIWYISSSTASTCTNSVTRRTVVVCPPEHKNAVQKSESRPTFDTYV